METQTADLTVAVQDYLKAIYALETAGERVTTSALAGRMSVSAPSATAMTKRLAELGFPTHDPHGDPIPDRELRVAAGGARSLVDLVPGERASVSRVHDGDPELL